MRLINFEKNIIKESILLFDNEAKIYLFGSRIDDAKKGGDIDILVISNKINYSNLIKIKAKIFNSIEEQKLDIVIANKNNMHDPFINIALKSGVLI